MLSVLTRNSLFLDEDFSWAAAQAAAWLQQQKPKAN
jgi:hypothetical protein